VYLNRYKFIKSTSEDKTLQILSFTLLHYYGSYKNTLCLSHPGIIQQFTCCCMTNCYGTGCYTSALWNIYISNCYISSERPHSLHLKNSCPPDVVHFRASRSETCLSLLMSLSFSNCWGQRVQSARVYLLDRMPCRVAMAQRSFSFLSMMTPRCCEGPPAPVHHRNWQSNIVHYVASLQLKDHSFCLICQTLSCHLLFPQNVVASQSKWWGTER